MRTNHGFFLLKFASFLGVGFFLAVFYKLWLLDIFCIFALSNNRHKNTHFNIFICLTVVRTERLCFFKLVLLLDFF